VDRTEEQKLTQDPIMVVLGGKEYPISPLSISESRAWRVKVMNLLKSMPKQEDVENNFLGNMTSLFITIPDVAADLFFSYAKNLNRDEIESVSNDIELAVALEKVIDYARPLGLVQSLTKAIPRMIQ